MTAVQFSKPYILLIYKNTMMAGLNIIYIIPPVIFKNNVVGLQIRRNRPPSLFIPLYNPPSPPSPTLSYDAIVLHNGNPGWNNRNQ